MVMEQQMTKARIRAGQQRTAERCSRSRAACATRNTRVRLLSAVAAGAAAAAVAGCGAVTAPGPGAAAPAASASRHPSPAASRPGQSASAAPASRPASAAKIAVTITVRGMPGAAPKRWTLRCDPPGGTHPNPVAACRALLQFWNPYLARPRRLVCPMIAASVDQADIRGLWFGHRVHKLVVDGGCDVRLWSALSPVFH